MHTRKKKFRVLPTGVEPTTFRLPVRTLCHWATGDSWESPVTIFVTLSYRDIWWNSYQQNLFLDENWIYEDLRKEAFKIYKSFSYQGFLLASWGWEVRAVVVVVVVSLLKNNASNGSQLDVIYQTRARLVRAISKRQKWFGKTRRSRDTTLRCLETGCKTLCSVWYSFTNYLKCLDKLKANVQQIYDDD